MISELNHKKEQGFFPMTLEEIDKELNAIGYKLDRSRDCYSVAQYMTGERKGETYPCITTGIVEIDTGLSFSNVDARRDTNFERLQDMRLSGKYYAVVKNSIFEI